MAALTVERAGGGGCKNAGAISRQRERERGREGGGLDKLVLREIPQFVNSKVGTRKQEKEPPSPSSLVFPNWTGRKKERAKMLISPSLSGLAHTLQSVEVICNGVNQHYWAGS